MFNRADAFHELNLPEDSDVDSIRTAYKRLALKWHPSKHNNSQESTMKFLNIGLAYKILTIDYDDGDSEDDEMSFSMDDCMDLFNKSFVGHSLVGALPKEVFRYIDNDTDEDDDDNDVYDGSRKYNRLTDEQITRNANELIEQEKKEKEKLHCNGTKKKKKSRGNGKQQKVEKNNNVQQTVQTKEDSPKKSKKKTEEDELDTSSAFFARAVKKNKIPVNIKKTNTTNPTNGKAKPVLRDEDSIEVTTTILRSRELAKKGNELAKSGHYAEAIHLFKDAIRLDSNDHRFYSNRSFCYDQIGKYDLALKDANKAIQIDSEWPKGYFRKGRALMGLKKYSEAEDSFIRVIKYDNQSIEAKQQIIRTRELKLMEFGFETDKVQSALYQYKTVTKALDHLLAGSVREMEVNDQIYLPDNELEVNQLTPDAFSVDAENPNGLTALWVGNVLPAVTEKILKQLFSRCGNVTSVRCLPEKFCAFINFADKFGAGRAIKCLQGVECGGQNLLIKFPDNPGASTVISSATVLKSGPQKGSSVGVPAAPAVVKPRHVTVPDGECYYWRTTGCSYGDRCRKLHRPEYKGLDKKPWHA